MTQSPAGGPTSFEGRLVAIQIAATASASPASTWRA